MQITINDNEYPLQWGMGALEIYCDIMGCDLDGLGMVDDASQPLQMQKAIVTLIFASIKNGCDVNDQPCLLTSAKLRVYLDELPQDKFKAIMDDFTNSKYLGKTLREHLFGPLQTEEVIKKKPSRSPSVKR